MRKYFLRLASTRFRGWYVVALRERFSSRSWFAILDSLAVALVSNSLGRRVLRLYIRSVPYRFSGRGWFDKLEKVAFRQRRWRGVSIVPTSVSGHRLPHLYFVHIPKCGGTSFAHLLNQQAPLVEVRRPWQAQSLVRAADREKRWNLSTTHMASDALVSLKVFSADELSRVESISLVRNPLDRFISLYKYHQRTGVFDPSTSIENYLDKVEKFVESGRAPGLHSIHGIAQTLPQSRWLRPSAWSGPKHLVRLEHFAEDLEATGLTLIDYEFPRWNSAPATDVGSGGLASSLVQRVKELYSTDYELLDY